MDSRFTLKIKRDSGFSGEIIWDSGFKGEGGYSSIKLEQMQKEEKPLSPMRYKRTKQQNIPVGSSHLSNRFIPELRIARVFPIFPLYSIVILKHFF